MRPIHKISLEYIKHGNCIVKVTERSAFINGSADFSVLKMIKIKHPVFHVLKTEDLRHSNNAMKEQALTLCELIFLRLNNNQDRYSIVYE